MENEEAKNERNNIGRVTKEQKGGHTTKEKWKVRKKETDRHEAR